MLKISNLSKRFGHKVVLDNISITIDRGQIALFLGASGVGKSTLLRVLNNLEVPDNGVITLDDKVLDLSQVNTTHTVGMVFQQFNLFENLTVEDNIIFPLQKAAGLPHAQARARAHELLRQYELIDKAHEYPAQLSGGQKQRLAIARTIALKPRIICLDEPTSALDPLLTSFVAASIQELAHQGYIVLVASHDIKLLEKLTCTVYLMEHGKIVETAGSIDLRNNPAVYPKISNFVRGQK